jgi:hypothetical protein
MNDTEHSIDTTEGEPDPTSPGDTPVDDDGGPIALVGFPREGDPRRRRRLYRTPKSDTYVEIKVSDIVDPPSKIEDLEPGQIAIWVTADAEVTLVGYPIAALRARPPWPRH